MLKSRVKCCKYFAKTDNIKADLINTGFLNVRKLLLFKYFHRFRELLFRIVPDCEIRSSKSCYGSVSSRSTVMCFRAWFSHPSPIQSQAVAAPRIKTALGTDCRIKGFKRREILSNRFISSSQQQSMRCLHRYYGKFKPFPLIFP